MAMTKLRLVETGHRVGHAEEVKRPAVPSLPRIAAQSGLPAYGDPGKALLDPARLLALQQLAGNAAVDVLVQRAVAAPPHPGKPASASEPLYHLTIGEDDRSGITKAEAKKMLERHHARIKGATESQKEGLKYLREIHEDQWIVGGISDFMGGVKMPDDSIFEPAFAALAEARAAMDTDNFPKSADKLMEADFKYQDARNKVTDYREGTISGSSRSITVLKVTVAVGAVAATVATGGAAAAAEAGVLGTAGAVAVGAGTYGEFSEMGTQGGEMIAGSRQAGMFDPAAILKRTATDAVVGFVGALLGGALSKYLVRSFGTYLISNMSEEALAALGQELGVVGPLNPELVVSAGQKFFIEFFANTAVTPLTTAVQEAINSLGGGKFPGKKEFTDRVVHNMIEGGIMQLFFGALTHGWQAAGLETGMEPPSGGSERGGGSEVELDRGTGPAREVETGAPPAAPESQPQMSYGEVELPEGDSGLELDTSGTPVPPEQQPQMSYGEVPLEEGGASPPVDQQPAPVPASQQPQMSYGERDLPSKPGPSGLKLYRGKKPFSQVVPKAKRTFGPPSKEPGGTGKRTGTAFHEYNAAEIDRMQLRVDYDPVAGRPRSVTYKAFAGKAPKEVSDRSFVGDTSTEGAQPKDKAYTHSGYERGHLGQRQAAAGYEYAEKATDLMTNVVPMKPGLNKGTWKVAEERSFDLANQVKDAGLGDHVDITVEPVYGDHPPRLKDGTPIPEAFIRTVRAPDGTVLESDYYLNQ
jgi:hypothetical protein